MPDWAKRLVRNGTRDHPRVARAYAGSLPAPHRQRRLQDDKLRTPQPKRTSPLRSGSPTARTAKGSRSTVKAPRLLGPVAHDGKRKGPEQETSEVAEEITGALAGLAAPDGRPRPFREFLPDERQSITHKFPGGRSGRVSHRGSVPRRTSG